MTHLDAGHYGAKVTSWDESSHRAFFKKIADEWLDLDQDELFKKILIAADVDAMNTLHVSVWKYWFKNAYNWWDIQRRSPKTPKEKAKAKAKQNAKVEKIKKIIRAKAQKMVLMDLVMANGKPLRDCTGRECSKFGGWLNKVAGKIGANGVVGKNLSESDLQKMFKPV